jgi:phosphorylated adapter RNA export protein
MWRAMLQEECLTENLQTFDVCASRKRKHERGAESYDFQLAQNDLNDKRKRFDNDSSSSNNSNKGEKRQIKKAKHRNKKHALQTPKILPNILISFNNSDEEYGQMMAKGLEEEKSDLIVRVVSVIGKDESLKLYSATQNIEKKGGMMTINKQRRRTPGGIFLWLLKTSNKIEESKKKEIFEGDKEKQMQDGNWTPVKTDPPPPSPAGEISTNVNPDPNLVSQKILNSIPDDDILDLDYNEDIADMDTF